MDSSNKFFSSVRLQNEEQKKLDEILAKIFKEAEAAELIPTLRLELPYKLFVCREVQENYDLYRSIRTELNSNGIDVPETHLTGPLISRRLISTIWEEEERMVAMREYDEIRLQMGRERRDLGEETNRERGSEVARIITPNDDNDASNSSHLQASSQQLNIHQAPAQRREAEQSSQQNNVQPTSSQQMPAREKFADPTRHTEAPQLGQFMPSANIYFPGGQQGMTSFQGPPAFATGNGDTMQQPVGWFFTENGYVPIWSSQVPLMGSGNRQQYAYSPHQSRNQFLQQNDNNNSRRPIQSTTPARPYEQETTDDMREAKRRTEERRRAIKGIQSYYTDKRTFTGSFESNWYVHIEDYVDMCANWDVPDNDKISFFKFSLANGTDARQYYDSVITQSRDTKTQITWNQMVEKFEGRYASLTKQTEISNRLEAIRIDDVREDDEDDYAALDRLTKRINRLAPMARAKDRDDEAKVRFLTKAVAGTKWGLHAQQRIPVEPSFQRLTNALYTSMREIGTYQAASNQSIGSTGEFRKSLWKRDKQENNSESKISETFMAEFFETLFAGQKRWARDPKMIQRGNHSINNNSGTHGRSRRALICFNCERQGCALRRCKMPKDYERIKRNLNIWKQRKGLDTRASAINTAEYIAHAESDEELLEVMLALASGSESEEHGSPSGNVLHTGLTYSDDSKLEEFNPSSENVRHTGWKYSDESDSQSSEDIFFIYNDDEKKFKKKQEKLKRQSNQQEKPPTRYDGDFNLDIMKGKLPLYNQPNIVIRNSGKLTGTFGTKTGHKNTVSIHYQQTEKKLSKKFYSSEFQGACIDTGAAKSVCGSDQAQSYCRELGIEYKLRSSQARFRFGDHVYHSFGTILVRIPFGNHGYFSFDVDVVSADIPLIIGLSDLRTNGLLLNYLNDRLEHIPSRTSYPVKYKHGHSFYEWKYTNILLTRHELQRLHLHFMHPTSNKLFQLIKRARPNEADESVRQALQRISQACEQCRELSIKPLRFRASIPPDQIIFNHEVSIDLMWLEQTPILHIVDTHTGFQNAAVLRGKTVQDVWNTFVECWATTYTGYPNTIRLDQEASFTAGAFRNLATAHGIILQFSGVKSHNSIGAGEKYHDPLRRVFTILRSRYPNLDPETILRYAVKGLNDTMGPEGYVPSMLVFGSMPSFPIFNKNLPGQQDRLNAMKLAREEVANIRAEQRIQRAIKHNVPPSAHYKLKSGDNVYAYSETRKKWISGITIVDINGKNVWINDGNRIYKVNISQVIPSFDDKVRSNDVITLLRSLAIFKTDEQPGICITEVLSHDDRRGWSKEFMEAKRKEIEGLVKKGAFKTIQEKDIPKNANIMGGRFILAIKNAGTDEEICKARFVVQGHTDSEKNMMVHQSSNIRQQSIRLITTMAAIYGYRLWTQDVTQAYLQSESGLTRDVYIKPKGEMSLKEGELLQLKKPLYGLTDSGDYWHFTMTNHLKNDLGMQQLTGDLACFFRTKEEHLEGIIGIHVDDSIGMGRDEFIEESMITSRKFESKDRVYNNITFAGLNIEKKGKNFFIHQKLYASRLKELSLDCTFDLFRARRHEIAWLTNTRPDLCAAVAVMARVTEQTFEKKMVKLANSTIRKAKFGKVIGLHQHDLDLKTLNILAYSDSSFANHDDLSTQLGYAILLTDATYRVNWISYGSYKCRRVVRSVLGGETYAFADCFDFAYALQHDIKKLIGRTLPLTILTDSESLFKTLVKSSTTAERRLMIDIRVAREAYERNEITNIGWIRSNKNIADGLTKVTTSEVLEKALSDGTLQPEIEQWIVRAQAVDGKEQGNSDNEPVSHHKELGV